MVNMTIVNSEQCGGDNKHYVVVEVTHAAHSRQTHKTQGGCRVTCVLAELRAHYPEHQHKEEEEEKEEEGNKQRDHTLSTAIPQ